MFENLECPFLHASTLVVISQSGVQYLTQKYQLNLVNKYIYTHYNGCQWNYDGRY